LSTSREQVFLYTGTATLTVAATRSLSTSSQLLTITADDMDFQEQSSISTGTTTMLITTTTASHNIALGGTTKDMQISDSELGAVHASGGLIIGDSSSGHIYIDGIADSSSDNLGILLLRATKAGKIVHFTNANTEFNKGITVQTSGGVALSASMSTKQSISTLLAGTGTVSVASAPSMPLSVSSTLHSLSLGGAWSVGVTAAVISSYHGRRVA
jgi:hypothetical protein